MTVLDDIVPTQLQMWTTATLEDLRDRGVGETLFFEFKSDFEGRAVSKTACAFANAYGGFLLHGATASPANVVDGYPGVDPGDWLRSVGDNIVGHVSTLPVWDTVQIESPDAPTRYVVVTRIEPSERTPHLVMQTGKIYVRTPAGSDPVHDKATLDRLVERGRDGRAKADARAAALHAASPGAGLLGDPGGSPYVVSVAVVPSQGRPDDFHLLTKPGYEEAAAIYSGDTIAGGRPKRLTEDSVVSVAGLQALTRFVDGAVFMRELFLGNYIGIDPITDRIRDLVQAARSQEPPVREAVVDVRVASPHALQLDPDGRGTAPTTRQLSTGNWEWIGELATDEDTVARVAAALGRRLYRTVGDPRGHEPA